MGEVRLAIKVVLFDLDDTLFDFAGTWNVVLKRMFAEHPVTGAFETEMFFGAFQTISDDLYTLYEKRTCTLEEYRNRRIVDAVRHFGGTLAEEEAEAFNLRFVAEYMESLRPQPEVLELLERLRERYALGIITNGPHDMQERKVERLGLAALFPPDRVWISHAVGFGKPDPRIYMLALEHFQAAPAEAVFVGDSWEADVAGPIRAGLQAVWMNKYGREPKQDVQPLAVINRLEELSAILL